MKISVLQMRGNPDKPDKRLEQIDWMLSRPSAAGAEIAIFPELSLIGYTCSRRNFELAQPIPGPACHTLTEIACHHDIIAVVGLSERFKSHFYNSLVVVGPEGLYGSYRKVNVSVAENAYWHRGSASQKPVDTDLGSIGLGICADMFYPYPWLEYREKVDLVAIASAWPLSEFRYIPYHGRRLSRMHLRCTQALPELISQCMGVPVAFANCEGMHNGLAMAGNSRIVQNHTLVEAGSKGETALLADIKSIGMPRTRAWPDAWPSNTSRFFRRMILFGEWYLRAFYKIGYAFRPREGND